MTITTLKCLVNSNENFHLQNDTNLDLNMCNLSSDSKSVSLKLLDFRTFLLVIDPSTASEDFLTYRI